MASECNEVLRINNCGFDDFPDVDRDLRSAQRTPDANGRKGNGIVFAGRDGPPEAGEQIGQSAQTAGRMKDGACE